MDRGTKWWVSARTQILISFLCGCHDHALGHETVVARVRVGGEIGFEPDIMKSNLFKQILNMPMTVEPRAIDPVPDAKPGGIQDPLSAINGTPVQPALTNDFDPIIRPVIGGRFEMALDMVFVGKIQQDISAVGEQPKRFGQYFFVFTFV